MNGTLSPSEMFRFRTKFVKGGQNECWEWFGEQTGTGHGRFHVRSSGGYRERIIASRLALILESGYPEDPFLLALHTCDNPPCVNPAHLYWGTDLQNSQDAVRRGRKARGEKVGNARLTDVAVIDIRRRSALGESMQSIADEFHVTDTTVRSVVRRATWKHVA